MLRTPPAPFGTQATRLHGGRIVLVVGTLLGLAFAGWVWIFHKGAGTTKVATESATAPGWTAAQMHYEKPEVKAEAPAPKPVDTISAKLAEMLMQTVGRTAVLPDGPARPLPRDDRPARGREPVPVHNGRRALSSGRSVEALHPVRSADRVLLAVLSRSRRRK